MNDTPPLLHIIGALPEATASRLPPVPLELRIMAEDSVVIEVHDASQATEFADLCCGLLPVRDGTVRFLGHDWADASFELASALRGRIGQVHGGNSWIDFLPTDVNILLPLLHHTWIPEAALRARAAELSRGFGLPGLPLTRPDELTVEDRVRAACVRAFMGEPRLVILKGPELEQVAELRPTLVNALVSARNRRTATMWLTQSHVVWTDRSLPATARLRLTEHGLVTGRALR